MVNEVKKKKNKNIEMKIKTPEDIEELKEQLHQIKEVNGQLLCTLLHHVFYLLKQIKMNKKMHQLTHFFKFLQEATLHAIFHVFY